MTAVRGGWGRTAAVAGLTLALLAVGVWHWPQGSGSEQRSSGACSWRSVLARDGARWPSCRRPYDAGSPFNQRLRSTDRLTRGSPSTASWLATTGSLNPIVVGDPGRDGGVPVYRSRPHDPLYTLNCTKPWGRCEIEGDRVRIPAAARPAGIWPNPPFPTDGHLTVIDPRSRQEYDLWAVSRKSKRGGRLNFAWGGKTAIHGDGLGSGAVAAQWGSIAGSIRARELVSGKINHALAITVPCTTGHVYPARGTGLQCREAGMPAKGAPAMGTRFQLDISEAEIRAMALPHWQQAILLAMSRYGAYVSDTTSQPHWGFEYESGADYFSFGDEDPRIRMAMQLGLPAQDFNGNGYSEYWLYFSDVIDWNRVRVIAPCVSRGTCR